MKKIELETLTVSELVDRFAKLAVAQDNALFRDEISEVNRLFDELGATEEALKIRPCDRRMELLKLYDHPNPQAGEAGMSIRNLKRGIFKPD